MTTSPTAITPPRSVFSRVVVGVDGSYESREAARLAAALADGELTLLAVFDAIPAYAGTTVGMTTVSALDPDVQRQAAEDALRGAVDALEGTRVTQRLARGRPWEEILREAERDHATVVVAGSHGNGRASGILAGSTATELIHKAPCSVLVTRDVRHRVPASIAVGVDGSPESAAAYTTARALAARIGAKLRPVIAAGGKGVDTRRATEIAGDDHEYLLDDPVTALTVAAVDADLLVVGSRGLHGLRSLGSVSERVAHRARSSVLIVRG